VIVRRDATAFQYPLLLACLSNGLLWAWYGSVLQDSFVSGPNWVGVIVGAVQLTCKMAFAPSTDTKMAKSPV
jgi:hypothetical protein